MRVAIIGAGVSGLVCASRLNPRHEVHVFESSDWIGGHAHTVDVELEGQRYSVDTGFIVYNERNYPLFSALLKQLRVETQPTRMTFGFASERTGVEYSRGSLNGIFAQRANLLRPSYWRMLAEIRRFFRSARKLLEDPDPTLPLGRFLDSHGFLRSFQDQHLLPMGAAIWSCPPTAMREFPAVSFAQFFENHGLLRLRDRPEWRVIRGGSARYVEKLAAPFRDRIRLSTPVRAVQRRPRGAELFLADRSLERFDALVFACHSDQALALLGDATSLEKEVLGSIQYQDNEVILHADASMLPRSPHALAAWNHRVPASNADQATVTYHMNALQGLRAPRPLLVTLNSTGSIDPNRILARYEYAHPIFDARAIQAQQTGKELGKELRTAYCGAYWGYGFHEDGVRSGLLAAEQIERLER